MKKQRQHSDDNGLYIVKAMVFLVVIYACDSWIIKKKLSAKELMLSNCGAGEDS